MKSIILIGMPACGKSTAGVLLAKTAGLSFIDTDLMIQKHEEALLADIIENRGIAGFLKAEEEILTSIDVMDAVISTGGSAVYSKDGMENLKRLGKTVFIDVSLEELKRRLDNIKTRGVVMDNGETLETLYERRLPLYRQYADVTIHADGMQPEGLAEEILKRTFPEKLNKYN